MIHLPRAGGRHFDSFNQVPTEKEVYPEWFRVDDADDCDQVPDEVRTGKPRDVCDEVSGKDIITKHLLSIQIFSGRSQRQVLHLRKKIIQ